MAAPWLVALPSALDLAMAALSAFCVSAWICALMLVTRSSPDWAGVVPSVPVTSPAALTVTRWAPGLADQVDTGEAGDRVDVLGLHFRLGDRLQVAEDLGRVRAVGFGILGNWL